MPVTIHTLDLNYLGQRRSIASYLLLGGQGPVLVEVGAGSTFDSLIAGLAEHGLQPRDVRHAVVTHIHFDHAGAAGLLAEHGATIHVHEFGAGHLVDPSKLIASATRIYGEDMDRLWGRIVPIPESQVAPVRDGDVLDLDGVKLTAVETPGHARHHHALHLETDDGPVCFAGDAAAMIVPGTPGERYISLPTPPPEFDMQAWLASLQRLKAMNFNRLYLTHFGVIENVNAHLDAVAAAIVDHAEYVRGMMSEGLDEAQVLGGYMPWVRNKALAAGVPEDAIAHFVSDNLLSMNVTGIMRYWTKRAV